MSVSLFQSAVNASAFPVGFPPLSAPDVCDCDDYYSYPTPPLMSDCQIAFRGLPSGAVPTAWYNERAAGEERNVLPLMVHHGTCEILFHTSGQSAKSVDPTWIVPNDIKAMAAWVLGRCLSAGGGGAVTKGLGNTIDRMNDATDRIFPDPALPPSTSYYSLHIWNHMPTGDIDWNPGDNDPSVGGAIADSLGRTITATPRGSPARKELQRRWDYLWAAVGRLEYGEPTGNWWDGPSKLDLTSSASQLALNETVGAASMTHGCYSNDCDGDATVA